MQDISIQEMMDAGAHFGHQTRRWNPKMRPYIYGVRSGIHIIDLQQTQGLIQKAVHAVEKIVSSGDSVLFVGTKNQAQEVIKEEALRANMPYVIRRWLGGMLTNFNTVSKSVGRLLELKDRREKNDFAGFTKKERLEVDREIERLEGTLGGIQHMSRIPGCLFVIDPQVEKIAVHEANMLGIPVIAVTDSNGDPDHVDHIIPANDDAVRSIRVFTHAIAEACLKGLERREQLARMEESDKPAEGKKKHSRKAKEIEGAGKAYVSKADTFDAAEKVDSFSASVKPEEIIPPGEAG